METQSHDGHGAKPGANQTTGKQQTEQGSRGKSSSGSSLSPQRSTGALTRSIGTHPFSSMMQLSREMDRLMDSFFGRSYGSPEQSSAPELWLPRIDVRQRGDSLLVCADLPGVRKEDIRIDATGEGLAISGERRDERQEGEGSEGYRMTERTYGSFYREIPLPEGAKVEEAKASMREGVLEITVPLQQGQGRRQIQVE